MPRHAREKKIISIELIFLSILRILRNITNSRVEESKNRAITDEHANVSNSGFQFHRYPHRAIIQRNPMWNYNDASRINAIKQNYNINTM